MNFSPTMFPIEHVLIPTLVKMGMANLSVNILKYGFFPDIKGKVEVIVPALKTPIQAIQLV